MNFSSRGTLTRLIVTAVLAAIGCTAHAERLFDSNEPLALEIVGPIRQIIRDKADEPEDRPALVRYRGADGALVTHEIGLRVRGKSRRSSCKFPPLRLNFDKDAVKGTLFRGQDKLKLVTHCRTRSRSFEQLVLKEYLVYRMLNLLTDRSFRVRLLDITYTEESGKGKPISGVGFLIEDKKKLAKRLDAEFYESGDIGRHLLPIVDTNRIAMFQLLIGNTDFSFRSGPEGEPCCHNSVLFKDVEGRVFTIPYDFDSNGTVDPPYAAPSPNLPIRDVRQRLYRGYCVPDEILNTTIAEFNDRRADFYALFEQEPRVSDKTRQRTLRYFDDFYEIINDPKKKKRMILEDCRGN